MGRIKVLQVIGGGEFGGAEQHLLTLMRHMNREEFEVHTACLFSEPLAPLIEKEGLPVYVFSMRSKLNLKPVKELASLISMEGFHIVHTHGVRANLIGRLAAKRAGITNVVTTVHSVLTYDYNKWINRWINKLAESSTRSITKRFITVCEKLAGQMVRDGVPVNKITTVHNGLEIEKYNPEISGQPFRQEFGIGPEMIVMGIVARLHPVKGHSILLEAIAKVKNLLPHIVLMIVGTGPDRSLLENKAEEMGISSKVIFAGFRQDIPQIIAGLDFLVLPSLSEGLSITVMEGMAMQKPVLATRVGGTPEIITDGVDGLLVPAADPTLLARAIEKLALDREKAEKMGVAARKTIEARFTAQLMAEKTSDIYKELLEGGKV